MEETLPPFIEEHSHTLQRKLRTAVQVNDYGRVTSDSTKEVVEEFLESVPLSFDWKIIEAEAITFTRQRLRRIIEENRNRGFDPDDLPNDGNEFEYWVADAFKKFDWDAEVTKSSGDQGLDVIVEKDGVRIGIQTKLYNSPVGNKAVQEAYTGIAHYGLSRAAVLTNAGFTKSAVELAANTGVVLMSQYDIPKADNLFLFR